jgi:hypothetical protein
MYLILQDPENLGMPVFDRDIFSQKFLHHKIFVTEFL